MVRVRKTIATELRTPYREGLRAIDFGMSNGLSFRSEPS